MCGIAGLIRLSGLSSDDVPAVTRMTAAQAHRGPSACGIHSDSRAALGHRRLSIIDVSAAAHQPMCNEDGSVWLTYNGEIYNHLELRSQLVSRGHQFRSRADTEVILHGYEEWGVEGLMEQLRGMFAFGLYDSGLGLVLARDRLGIKPLYYYVSDDAGLVLFASEVRALLKSGYVPSDRDPEALAGFLLAGSVPAPRTIVKRVSSLLPGHFLVWRDGHASNRKYWDLSQAPPSRPELIGDSIATMRSMLQDSVSRHLMSDVPLGVFLSGGVDSGAVVAVASRVLASGARPLTTLTVTFDEQEFTEAQPTRDVANRFRTDHHEVRVTRSQFVTELPKILAAMDQPTNDGVNTYFVSKAAAEAGLTVVLSGLGGDEVFWGYGHYRWLAGGGRWLARCPSLARMALVRAAATWGQVSGRDNWMRTTFLASGASSKELYLLMRGFFPPQHVMRLLEIDQRELDAAVERQFDGLPETPGDGASAVGFNHLEFKRYLHDQLLRDTDVFSMAHSIEVRVPLLDHTIVEYAATIRPEFKIGNGINKPVLVGAVDDPLLLKAGAAKKRGFSFPMDIWMRESADELEEMAVSGDVLNRQAVQGLWTAFRAGRLHWSRAWAMSVLGATIH
jgi:asparagine synthase (glutamine-hydrolysing)